MTKARKLRGVGTAGAIALGAIAGMAARAQASEMSASGSTLTITGEIHAGDEFKFREALKRSTAITSIRLDSPGGSIAAAGDIARQIRGAGLKTVVDAARDTCASSCTILFAGGSQRAYLHADRIGGLSATAGFKGLGFHQASTPGQIGAARYNGEATATMMGLFYELGVPSAANLVDKAPPGAIYGLSGAQARAQGISTL